MDEQQRILVAYQKRKQLLASKTLFFGYESPSHVFRIYERYFVTMQLLKHHGYHPLANLHILDVGCGNGRLLRQFLEWGASPDRLVGVELREEPVQEALFFNANIDVKCGSATELPWPDESFDLVTQHTVFTSVLDQNMRIKIAAEMKRVLRPGGAILWFDFVFDNPRNPDVKGVRVRDVQKLFPDFVMHGRKIVLAPFIARKLPVFTVPVLYPLLNIFSFLRTHYLALLIKPE